LTCALIYIFCFIISLTKGNLAIRRPSEVKMHEMAQLPNSPGPILANAEGVVSVLFCDITPFNEIMSDHEPRVMVAILDAYVLSQN